MVKFNKVDGGRNRAADKLSKSWKIVKNPKKNLKGLESLQKAIGSKEHLPKYQFSVN